MSSAQVVKFGQKLKKLRKREGFSQEQVAERLGFNGSNSFISQLEAGKKLPSAETVLAVARLFDVSTDVLLKDELDLPFEQHGAVSPEPGAKPQLHQAQEA